MICQWFPGFLLNYLKYVLNVVIYLLSCSKICSQIWQCQSINACYRSRYYGNTIKYLNILVKQFFPLFYLQAGEKAKQNVLVLQGSS